MHEIPPLIPISELRDRQNQILAALSEGPAVLTQHGRAAAVLVDPEQWNRLMALLADYQDAADAAEARQDLEPVISLEDYDADRSQRVSGPAR